MMMMQSMISDVKTTLTCALLNYMWYLCLFIHYYFRHDDGMITKLRRAGLGYNVNDEDTPDKFGE